MAHGLKSIINANLFSKNGMVYKVQRLNLIRRSSTINIQECLKNRTDIKTHEDLYRFSIQNPDAFWTEQARNTLLWSKDFTKTMDCDMTAARFRWFEDGQLNASVNCVDRHAAVNPNKVALIWERDEPGQDQKVTYGELLDMVCRIANVFKGQGIRKGDVVAIYMPISPLAVATMLACTRIGAIHSVVFAGFSAGAITSRIRDANAVAIVTANEGVRGGKAIPLRKTVRDALANDSCPSIKHTFVMNRTENQSHNELGTIQYTPLTEIGV